MNPKQKAGYVAVIGRPNVGKSSLMNHLLGQKIAIISRKPQTTRHVLYGIDSGDHHQIIYIDTPGLHRHTPHAMNRHMNRMAKQSMDFVDIIVHVSEVGRWQEEDQDIIELLNGFEQPKIHVLNKIDKCKDKTVVLSELEKIHQAFNWHSIIPVSAQQNINLHALKEALISLLPEQDFIYSPDEITTATMRFMAAEIIREKLFRYLHQEIPYQLGVLIDDYREERGMVFIHATILLERESQKAIVIGKGGQTLKLIGQRAREDLEKMLAQKVVLKNFVKSKENWQDNEAIMNSMGHG